MLQFLIGFAFLMVLLIPVGIFIASLIYLTGQEMRKNYTHKPMKRQRTEVEEIPIKERLRVVR